MNLTDVVVIGAGPYGLSVAAHLRAAGVPFRIFGEPMATWRNHMPEGMLVKSDGFATNLSAPGNAFPLSDYCRSIGHPYSDIGFRTPIATLIGYAEEFRQRHVGTVEACKVVELTPHERGYNVHLDSGELVVARQVIVATGLTGFKRLPAEFADLPEGMVSHSSDHNNLAEFAGQRVLVVGAGQSAVEMAALLNERGAHTTLVSRRPIMWFAPEGAPPGPLKGAWLRVRRPNFGLGPGWRIYFWSEVPAAYPFLPSRFRLVTAYGTLGPAGSGWIKHRVHGVVPTVSGPLHGIAYRNGEIQLSCGDDRQVLTADRLIAATGYKVDISRLPFLSSLAPALKTLGGAPVLNQRFESVSAPGLYFIGYASAPTFGPSMRFIYGTRFAATRLTRHIGPQYQRRAQAGRLDQQAA